MAIPRRHLRHGHARRVVLQTAAGLAACGSRRQHVLGLAPVDPNLLAQGIPPDDRVTADKRIFGPVEGTPLPLGAIPRGTPAGPPGANPPPGTNGAGAP